MGYKEYQIYM